MQVLIVTSKIRRDNIHKLCPFSFLTLIEKRTETRFWDAFLLEIPTSLILKTNKQVKRFQITIWFWRKDHVCSELNSDLLNITETKFVLLLIISKTYQVCKRSNRGEHFIAVRSSKCNLKVSPNLPMVVMMVPQKKKAEARSQRLVKLAGRLLTSRPASTADITPCSGGLSFM